MLSVVNSHGPGLTEYHKCHDAHQMERRPLCWHSTRFEICLIFQAWSDKWHSAPEVYVLCFLFYYFIYNWAFLPGPWKYLPLSQAMIWQQNVTFLLSLCCGAAEYHEFKSHFQFPLLPSSTLPQFLRASSCGILYLISVFPTIMKPFFYQYLNLYKKYISRRTFTIVGFGAYTKYLSPRLKIRSPACP